MKLSKLMPLSDWLYVKAHAGEYALLVAAIGALEQGVDEEYPEWGTNPKGTGRDWILGYDFYNGPGGKNPAYKGFTNQIDVVSDWMKKVFVLPVNAHNLYEFSRNYWKAGTNQEDRDAWAKAVWALLGEIVNDWDAVSVKGHDPRHRMHLKPSPPETMHPRFRDAIGIPEKAPASFFWPTLPARDQGDYPDCTGFGSADLMDRLIASAYDTAGDNPFITSALYIFEQGGGNDQGGYITAMLDVLVSDGVPPETDWPISLLTEQNIDNLPPIPAAVNAEGAGQNISDYNTIVDEEELQAALLIAPVAIGINVYTESFENAAGGIIRAPNSVPGDLYVGGHDVTIDGYDTTKQLPGYSTPGAYRGINSWGKGWGDNGYFWLHPSLITNSVFMQCLISVTPKITVPVAPPAPPTPPAPPANGLTIVLTVGAVPDLTITGGSDQALVNGVEVPINDPAFLADNLGRVYLPVRAIAELLGCVVTWNEATKQVTIFQPAGNSDPAVVSEYIEQFPAEGK